jgi:pantoate--beta-alanine ligase
MQRWALAQKRKGRRIGFVPTMGYLHEGHVSLATRARQAAGKNGVVVLSIYVNPAQFGPAEDFARYPRDLARDKKMCREAGVDVVFAPADAEMYLKTPGSEHSVYVVEEALSKPMEGAARPAHFRGVTTIVAKLFNLVLPDVAVFGAKDFQQAAVIQRMTRDLNFPLRIIVAPTKREADGLAMSSRNKYLNPEERQQATALNRAISLGKPEAPFPPASCARPSAPPSRRRRWPGWTILKCSIPKRCVRWKSQAKAAMWPSPRISAKRG